MENGNYNQQQNRKNDDTNQGNNKISDSANDQSTQQKQIIIKLSTKESFRRVFSGRNPFRQSTRTKMGSSGTGSGSTAADADAQPDNNDLVVDTAANNNEGHHNNVVDGAAIKIAKKSTYISATTTNSCSNSGGNDVTPAAAAAATTTTTTAKCTTKNDNNSNIESAAVAAREECGEEGGGSGEGDDVQVAGVYTTTTTTVMQRQHAHDDDDVVVVVAVQANESAAAADSATTKNTTTATNKNRIFRRSSWKKIISRIAQHVTSIGAKQQSSLSSNRVPPLRNNAWPPDQTPGVTGLKNHGNTCFMNAVLQCLSHTDILAQYFVLDQYKADLKRRNKLTSRKFGTKGELTEQLALVLKALWTCKNESDYSTSFKAAVDRYGSQFRSSTQHDAQEFLFWLLDKVHEDLNTASKRKYKSIKDSFGRPDEQIAAETLANHIRCNSSFVQDVFQAQFRSSLACPQCHKQSNTFDPFHCISVQLPQLTQQAVFVTVLYATQHPRQVKLGIGVPHGSPVIALREQLQADTGIEQDRIMLVEIGTSGYGRVLCDSDPMSSLGETDPIFCIETMSRDVSLSSSSSKTTAADTTNLTLIIVNVQRKAGVGAEAAVRFGTPLCMQIGRDVSYNELQKKLLKQMQTVLKSEIFAYATQPTDMFKIRLHEPSADPDTYIDPNVEHPLFTEMIDLALSVLPGDVGPTHVKLVLEWQEPERFFHDMTDAFVEHESVTEFKNKCNETSVLTLAQCLEHYTKAETLSAEDAWRCPHCQKYLPVVKTLGLWSLPDILVIHFKRFRQQHTKGPQSAKLTTAVQFPLNGFDMTPHLASSNAAAATAAANDANGHTSNTNSGGGDNWSPWNKLRRREHCMQQLHQQQQTANKDNRYDLYAVCYHQGDTLETGHYTAACKNPYDLQWYKFDDQKVSQVPADNIPGDIVNNEAYILFYQRRKCGERGNTESPSESSASSSSSSSSSAAAVSAAPDHWVSKIAIVPTTISQQPPLKVDDGNVDAAIKCIPVEVAATDSIKVQVELEQQQLNDSVLGEVLRIEKTNENELIDIEALDGGDHHQIAMNTNADSCVPGKMVSCENLNVNDGNDNDVLVVEPSDAEVELRRQPVSYDIVSTSVPTQRSLWASEYMTVLNRGSLNVDMLTENMRRDNIRNSVSTSLAAAMRQQRMNNDSMIVQRNISKDTFFYRDQSSGSRRDVVNNYIDEDNSYLGKSLWISPLTPPKLITVSHKN